MDNLSQLMEDISGMIKTLIGKKPLKISELKKNLASEFKNKYKKGTKKAPGVYLIRKEGEIIYIGETDNLIRRLIGDIGKARISINPKTGKEKLFHSLNRHIKEENSLLTSEGIKIEHKNYSFSYIETESKNMAKAIEGILIKQLSESGHLINK